MDETPVRWLWFRLINSNVEFNDPQLAGSEEERELLKRLISCRGSRLQEDGREPA